LLFDCRSLAHFCEFVSISVKLSNETLPELNCYTIMDQVTTLTFFRYETVDKKFWALKMMGQAHRGLNSVSGQSFYKLLGSGRGMGFNPLPDWNVYALLQVWDNREAADHYHSTHSLAAEFRDHSQDYWTIYLKTIKSDGEWSGSNPFETCALDQKPGDPLAVLTTAARKKRYLAKFWSYVPTSHRPLQDTPGLLFAKGIGEIPLSQMATFSLWEKETDMKAFAYQTDEHKKAIKYTRELGWYKEELFARFKPVAAAGSWQGSNPLENLI
jgi:hypothetical protein